MLTALWLSGAPGFVRASASARSLRAATVSPAATARETNPESPLLPSPVGKRRAASNCDSASARWPRESAACPAMTRPSPYSGSVATALSAHTAALSRSEEHTSELQSPCNLVCRLLLEKKKQKE